MWEFVTSQTPVDTPHYHSSDIPQLTSGLTQQVRTKGGPTSLISMLALAEGHW